ERYSTVTRESSSYTGEVNLSSVVPGSSGYAAAVHTARPRWFDCGRPLRNAVRLVVSTSSHWPGSSVISNVTSLRVPSGPISRTPGRSTGPSNRSRSPDGAVPALTRSSRPAISVDVTVNGTVNGTVSPPAWTGSPVDTDVTAEEYTRGSAATNAHCDTDFPTATC